MTSYKTILNMCIIKKFIALMDKLKSYILLNEL